ncbi:FecR family protein [uncultured Maritalea sp.]|uniref:FecR family protein n=1 Tax=uncultured Maritalea sp. TaxID=757249 RepID=UPI002605047A|nr:FecR family protein [uncultured Maritalea sp.]
MLKRVFGIFLIFVALSSAAFADDWVAKKLRGGVFVFQTGQWVQIKRGHVVSDESAIQTAKGARVLFARGKETIDVRGDTRIRISDRTGSKRTVVAQDFGSITVDVEKRNVQHFEVRAPLLAAVVKGTKFTVTATKGKASIKVERGRVEARDNKAGMKVDVKPRQEVELNSSDKPILTVEGRGTKEPIRSTANDAVLSVRQVIQKVETARPASPVKLAEVQKLAAQQGKSLSKSDREYAAKKELKAAKKSGNAKAIAQAVVSTQIAQQDEQAIAAAAKAQGAATAVLQRAAKNASSAAANAEQAEVEKKQADKALKEAKKSGDAAAIAEAAKAAAQAKANEKAAEAAAKAAEKAAKSAEKEAEKAAKDAEKAAKDAEKAAEKAAKDAEKAAKDAAKDSEDAAKDAAKAAEDALDDAKKSGDQSAIAAAAKAAEDAKANEEAVKKANDAAEDAAKNAEKAAKDAAKNAEDAAKDAAKDAEDAAKAAAETDEKAAKAAEDAAKDAAKAAEDAAKDADKAAKDAAKDAEKAAKDALKL